MNLNPEQETAVGELERDFVLAAGAGSGKTRVLTERFVRGVDSAGRDAFNSTLAITFTEKAAGELWQRVRAGVAETCGPEMAAHTDLAWISTIHSMCSRLLRRHALEAGLDPWFVIGSAVELGILRQRAFHHVAAAALEGQSSSESVIQSLGLTKTFDTVMQLSERLRAMGLSPCDIETAPSADTALVAEILGDLRSLAAEYEPLKQTKTVISNREWILEFVASGTRWLDGTLTAAEFAGAASSPQQNRVGAPQVKEIAEAVKVLVEQLALVAGQEAVRLYEQGLIDLASSFTEQYALARTAANVLDFEDLQGHVIELFERRADIAARYHSQFTSVMIDEFQDTNALQIQLIRSLAPHGFVAVGDERQSIYRFRHADVDIFTQRVANAATSLTLRTNYRSHPELVSFFNAFFGAEPFWPRDFMRLEAGRDGLEDASPHSGARVSALLVDEDACGQNKDEDEATVVAAHVRQLIERGTPPGDIVILMRAMTAAETFAGALRDAGVEVFVASGGTYFKRPEVIDLEMLLRVIANTKDDEALLHVLAGPMTDLSDDALAIIRQKAGRGALWGACRSADGELQSDDRAKLARVVEVVEWFRVHGARAGLADMIHEACERLEYDLTLFATGFDGARAWVNVLKLARIAEEFEQATPGDPQAFLEYLELKRQLEGRETLAAFAAEDVGAVRIMSVHAAKGLEFPVTIVANLGRKPVSNGSIILSTIGGRAFLGMKLPTGEQGQDSIPTSGYRHAQQLELEADLAEEKRLFYVACTRAQEALVMCGRTAFAKNAESPRLVGWLREALGFAGADTIAPGKVTIGDSNVHVMTPEPVACGPVGISRPGVDPDVLRIAETPAASTLVDTPATIDRISYSGLALHRTCAYRFYVSNVVRMGAQTSEITDNDTAVALGTAAHALLKISGGGLVLPQARVDEICTAAGLSLELAPEASELAQAFQTSDIGRRITACAHVLRERPFAVTLGPTVLDGYIDVIGWEGDAALIVDYKTGDPARQRDAQEYRAQAECYAVAAFALGATRVEVCFFELKGGRVIPFVYERADLDALSSRLSSQIEGVRSGGYEPLDRYSPFACPECPALGNLCPVSSPVVKPSG